MNSPAPGSGKESKLTHASTVPDKTLNPFVGIVTLSSVPSKSMLPSIFPVTWSVLVIEPPVVPLLLFDVLSFICGAAPDGSSTKCHTVTKLEFQTSFGTSVGELILLFP